MDLSPLISTFVLIFLAELGDKTLYMVLLLSAHHRALPVLLGAWAAFIVQSLIALVLGSLLAQISPSWVRWITAAVFLAFGLLLLFTDEKVGKKDEPVVTSDRRVFLATFGLVFAAEWGDATQVGSATLVARTGAPLQVFLGATLGLWAGTVLAILVGRAMGPRLPRRLLRRVAGVLFCVFSVVSLLKL